VSQANRPYRSSTSVWYPSRSARKSNRANFSLAIELLDIVRRVPQPRDARASSLYVIHDEHHVAIAVPKIAGLVIAVVNRLLQLEVGLAIAHLTSEPNEG
jgi:hypothetical protein